MRTLTIPAALIAASAALALAGPASADTVKCVWNQSVDEQVETCPNARVEVVTGCAVSGRATTVTGSCYEDNRDPDFSRDDEPVQNGEIDESV